MLIPDALSSPVLASSGNLTSAAAVSSRSAVSSLAVTRSLYACLFWSPISKEALFGGNQQRQGSSCSSSFKLLKGFAGCPGPSLLRFLDHCECRYVPIQQQIMRKSHMERMRGSVAALRRGVRVVVLSIPVGAFLRHVGAKGCLGARAAVAVALGAATGVILLHFMICHSNKCHRPRTSSCHKEQRGGTNEVGDTAVLVVELPP